MSSNRNKLGAARKKEALFQIFPDRQGQNSAWKDNKHFLSMLNM